MMRIIAAISVSFSLAYFLGYESGKSDVSARLTEVLRAAECPAAAHQEVN